MTVDVWLWFSILFNGILLIQFILNVLLLPRLRPEAPSAATPSVSVLVPARNEALRIRACLESLISQNYPSLEIVVLDDESQYATAELVRSLGFSTDPEPSRRSMSCAAPRELFKDGRLSGRGRTLGGRCCACSRTRSTHSGRLAADIVRRNAPHQLSNVFLDR